MDFLRRIGRFIGGAAQGVGRAFQQAPQVVSRAVLDAQRAQQQAVQQVQRNLPRFQAPPPPRIQLPQIQIPRVQLPQVRLPQAPRVDLGAVSRALQAPSQAVQQTTRNVLGQAGRTLGDLQRQSDAIRQRQIQQTQADIARFRTSPATAIFQTQALSPFGGISQAFKGAKVGTGRELPKFDTTKAVEDLSQTLAKTPLRKIKGMGVVGDVVKPLALSAARMADVAQTQEEYAQGIKGIGQMGSDIANIGSLFYAGGLSKQLATKGTAFLPTAARLAPRLAASGAGQNILLQLSEGKKLNELDPKQIAAAAAVYTGLGIGIPGVGRAVGKGVRGIKARLPEVEFVRTPRPGQVAPTPAVRPQRIAQEVPTSAMQPARPPRIDVTSPEAQSLKPANVAINKLKSIAGDRQLAMEDYRAGRFSMTDLPVLVKREKNGTLTVLDGNGRIIAAQEAGLKNIPVTTDEKLYREILTAREAEFAPGTVGNIYETVPESAMRPKAPKGAKERGFVTTVKESPQTEAATLTILKQADGSYKVKPNRILEKQANERITANVADAKTYAMTQTDDQAVATAGQLIKYFQAKGDYGQAAEVASQAAKTLTEAGRAIQAATLYNKLNPEGILQYASSKMQKVGRKLDAESAEILTDMAKKIEAMPDGEPKQIAIKELLDEVGRTQGSALPDKIITLWKAGLLTSPITTAGNLTSNTIKQVVKKAADDPVAALVDMTLGLATGKRTKTFTLRGIGEGGVEGLKRGGKYLKTGYDPRDPISKLDQKDVYFSKGFLGKIAKGYTDTVFRSLGAQDQPYFYAALKNTLYDEALAAAKTQGVKGQAREQFIKKFVNDVPSDLLDKATEEARTAVFQNRTFLGDIASKITQSNNPTVRTVGQFVMPFSRVPSAVATEIFERTPLGAAKEVVKQIAKKQYDQRALSTAISKSTTGTLGLMGLGYALDRGGNINLAMPTSQAEQNLWQQEGRQPFSIRIGDKYYSMNYIQPFGTLMAMGAQYNRSLREGGSQQDALSASFAMGAKAVTEQSFLRGVSGVLSALQDPNRYAERFVEQTAGSVIPNIVRTTARAFDPLQREITSAGEAVIAGIPGLRQTLQPKVDVFGKPIARPADPINTLFNPLRPTTARTTPELQETRRLFDVDKNVIPSEIDKNAFGKENPINQQQINDLKTAMGNAVLNRYQQIMADPRYGQLSDDQKAKALKDAKDAVIQGEKFKFANANNLPYTTADKLDKDTKDYINGVTKDTIAATLPKPPKVKVSKGRRGRRATGRRRTGRGRVAKVKVPKIKTPRVTVRGLPRVPTVKAKKVSFKVPKPKAGPRKTVKIKQG